MFGGCVSRGGVLCLCVGEGMGACLYEADNLRRLSCSPLRVSWIVSGSRPMCGRGGEAEAVSEAKARICAFPLLPTSVLRALSPLSRSVNGCVVMRLQTLCAVIAF